MKKRGGSGTLRRPCERRGCVATSSGEHVRPTNKKPRARPAAKKKAAPPPRQVEARRMCVEGVDFTSYEVEALCDAVGDEEGARIDWCQVAARLIAREASHAALLALRRAATRLEDETRDSRSRKRTAPPPTEEVVTPRETKWTPTRCQRLWHCAAYCRDEEDFESDDDDRVLDPFDAAYMTYGPKARKAGLAALPNRFGDLQAAALLCASRDNQLTHAVSLQALRPQLC